MNFNYIQQFMSKVKSLDNQSLDEEQCLVLTIGTIINFTLVSLITTSGGRGKSLSAPTSFPPVFLIQL